MFTTTVETILREESMHRERLITIAHDIGVVERENYLTLKPE